MARASLRSMPTASGRILERLLTWWCGVLAESHRPGLQIRMAQEFIYELGWAADTSPVVVPQRRHQPRAVGGEQQIWQNALPEKPGVITAPGGGLLRPRLDQHVMPSRIQGHHRRIGEDDVSGTGVEIPEPPRLACRLPAQHLKHGPVMLGLFFTSVRQHDRGV